MWTMWMILLWAITASMVMGILSVGASAAWLIFSAAARRDALTEARAQTKALESQAMGEARRAEIRASSRVTVKAIAAQAEDLYDDWSE